MLLHGYSDSAATWLPSLSGLVKQWSVLAVDARGHGLSGLPEEPFGPQAMADEAAMVLDSLEVRRQVTVIGGSMGGLTAAVLASRRPDLVGRLVLEEPAVGTRERRASDQHMGRPDWLIEVKALDMTARVAWARRHYPTWPDDELRPWAESVGQVDLRLHDLPWEAPVWLPEVIMTVRCPTSFILGDLDHGSLINAATESECLAVAAAGSTVVRIPGVGHGVHREARDDCLRVIETALSSAAK